MVGSLLLLKMLHCRKKCNENSTAPRKLKPSHVEIKPEIIEPLTKCRVCLKEGEIPIYGNNITEDVSEALVTFGGIDIEEDDSSLRYLCLSCSTLLQSAILFRKTAQLSDQLLKNCSKQVTSTHTGAKANSDSFQDAFMPDAVDDNSLDNGNVAGKEKNDKIYCKRCELEFASFEEYCEHRVSEEHENKKIVCQICNKEYAELYFKRHMAIHEPRPYICDICGKKFAIQGQFTRHRVTHFFKLPFKCSLCPYRGRFTESLKMHMRSHTGEKPYQCSECAARFVSKSNLNKHMLTHKQERPHKCASCGRGFYTKRHLEMHLKVDHAGIKDHVCDTCGKAFGYRKQMRKHQLKVHNRQKLRSGRMPLYLQAEKMGTNVDT